MGNNKSKFILGALTALVGVFFFNHSAYAASYLNVSSGSGGTISFGSIKPTSTGTSATTSDTLTIHTDCSVGYSVYVSGQDGKDTNLTNSSASSDNVISTSSNAIGSAGSLSSNTWGLNSENNGTYVGLPTYDDALDVALTTRSNVAEASTVPIYYGLKVNTALTPGTYTGSVLYTVIMDSTCLTKTVTVNTSGVGISALTGAGTYTIGSTVTLSYTMNDGYHLGSITATTDPNGDGTGGETITLTPDENNTTKTGSYTFTMPSDDVIVSAVGAANTYTIAYDGNGATSGSTESQTNQVYGSDIALQANGFTRTNYNFLGWSLDSTATSATYKADTSYAVSSLASAAGATNTNGATITLYAVWEEQVATMQNFNCASLASGTSTSLKDARDGQSYTVYRIPTDSQATNVAGKCFMTKDLNLGAVAFSSTASSKMATANGEMTLSPNDSGFTTPDGSGETITVPTSSVTISNGAGSWGSSSSSSTNVYTNKKYTASGTDNYAGRGYYTWGAAMVACPRGWRLPTTDEMNNSSSANASTAGISKAANNNLDNLLAAPWLFPEKSGFYRNNSYSDAGLGDSDYWTSTQSSSSMAHILLLRLSSKNTYRGNNDKSDGFAVRCIADATMQDFDAATVLSNVGDYTTVVDARDGNSYVVKRLPDNNVWMVENLKLVDTTLTAGDSNVSTNFVVPASTGPSSGEWCTDNTEKCVNKSVAYYDATYGAYYNWYTVTAGSGTYSTASGEARYDICPKGWRMPTQAEYENLAIAYGGSKWGDYGYSNIWSYLTGSYQIGNYGNFSAGTGKSQGAIVGTSWWPGAPYNDLLVWSSSAVNATNAYLLEISGYDNAVRPYYDQLKSYGMSVRCILK